MTSVVCDPNNPDVIWGGAAGGGVWRSDDAGRHWQSLWHNQATLNVGALAIDPRNAQIIYCGTGEANLSADSYPGVGVYASEDGGTNWTLIAPADTANLPTRIGVIAVDPFNSSQLWLAGVAHNKGGIDGLFRSSDSGRMWSRQNFPGAGPYRCHAIAFHPKKQGTLFATIDARGPQSGIWKSVNAGASWTQLKDGLPAPEKMGRTSLAISASNPDTMYAISGDDKEHVLGVFCSTDSGRTWKDIAGSHFGNEGQMSYGNCIAIHPEDPNWVICGGVDLHLTMNGGKTWQQATKWDAERGKPNYAHADHHRLLMPVGKPGRIYDVNDGGMDISEDGGKTWSNRSNGLAATMFYDIDVSQTDSRMFGGGAQDNGTNITTTGKNDDFFEITGGDGGWMIIDPTTVDHLYTTSQFMSVYRYRAGTGFTEVSPPADEAERNSVWMIFLEMDYSNPNTVFAGGLRVWRTIDDGKSWSTVSDILDNSAISAIEVARADPKVVFVGTENGGIFKSADGGASWSSDISGPTLPGFTVTRIITSPLDANTVFATVGNSGASHVFRSTDGGGSWLDVDQRRLADVPHHAVIIPHDRPSEVYVCSDAGVFLSRDAGENWANLTANLPNVPVVDLVYQEASGTLIAATYGRSLWRVKI